MIILINVPYSGKFSLVQNFAEVLATALEEIFVVLNVISYSMVNNTFPLPK
jgi:hypothetical protein